MPRKVATVTLTHFIRDLVIVAKTYPMIVTFLLIAEAWGLVIIVRHLLKEMTWQEVLKFFVTIF